MSRQAKVITIADTKGGSTKSTTAVNLAAFLAKSKLKTLLIDFDLEQPTACSYFDFTEEAPMGVYQFLISYERDLKNLISKTVIDNLDVMSSNSVRQEILSQLSAVGDGIIRLKSCIKFLLPEYDVIIIDTVGTIDLTVSMAVLSADIVLSPLEPSMPGVREYLRGTISNLFKSLIPFTEYGIKLPVVYTFFNRVEDNNDCRRIRESFNQNLSALASDLPFEINILEKNIKRQNSYKVAASLGIPAFQVYSESGKDIAHPYNLTRKQANNVLLDMKSIADNLLPEHKEFFDDFVSSEMSTK